MINYRKILGPTARDETNPFLPENLKPIDRISECQQHRLANKYYDHSMERVKGLCVSRVFTAHTDPVNGRDLLRLAQASQDCAVRMRRAVEIYVNSTNGPVTVRDAARAIARTEGKNVGGGTCVSALAALWQMDDPRAKACASGYICGT